MSIREKVAQLDSVRRELLSLTGQAEGDEYRLFPPPSPGEVRAHERRTGKALPPSVRAFLELANGWRGFMRGWTLLGLRRRETELFYREGLDEKLLRALPDLVPEAELKNLAAREKTDPKVLSPRDHHVLGVDGRGSALVLDPHRAQGGEPEVALVKYIWVQRRWPTFEAFLDEALRDATQELGKKKGAMTPAEAGPKKKSGKGKATKVKAKKKSKATLAPTIPKLRVVEIRPASKSKKKQKAQEKPQAQKPSGARGSKDKPNKKPAAPAAAAKSKKASAKKKR